MQQEYSISMPLRNALQFWSAGLRAGEDVVEHIEAITELRTGAVLLDNEPWSAPPRQQAVWSQSAATLTDAVLESVSYEGHVVLRERESPEVIRRMSYEEQIWMFSRDVQRPAAGEDRALRALEELSGRPGVCVLGKRR